MLLRLVRSLLGKKRAEAPNTEDVDPRRGTMVARDGSARPAVRLDVAPGADPAAIDVEAHPELRSAALLHTHYLPEVTPAAIFDMHRRYGRRWLGEVPTAERELHRVSRDPKRQRLRIGYVSPNFSSHSVAYLIEPVLACHDRDAFEVYAYHTAARRDATTERIEASVACFRQVDALTDPQLARRIADDRIDVLFDLAGHTSGGRLGVFARRPAPVQITWLGYPDTTGVPTIDYRVSDAITDPAPEADARHTERLLRLPGAFLCYQPPPGAPAPVARETPADRVVFCSFNTLEKVNATIIALWARVLGAVPGSRLLLKAGLLAEPAVAARVRNAFADHGVESSRVELMGWAERPADHLATYGRADIALDTFPYNGTITTCEAMWMGVPVVTLAGEAHMSRVGASLLGALGLDALVAHTADAYVETAASLAQDVARRSTLRAGLRERFAASALLDHAGFTHKLESAIRTAWIEWGSEAK